MNKRLKAQAAVFDGIMFLLLVSFSAALVYSFVSLYGTAEDTALRSSYELNYLQSVVKSVYFINVGTLDKVESEDITAYKSNVPPGQSLDDDTSTPDVTGCAALANYPGTLSVIDLVKKDLSDGAVYTFDDTFGTSVPMPGKMALRCAAKELLKPLAYASYSYFIELAEAGASNTLELVDVTGANVTNVPAGADAITSCDGAQAAGEKVFAVDSPFRVFVPPQGEEDSSTNDLVLRVCVWPKKP